MVDGVSWRIIAEVSIVLGIWKAGAAYVPIDTEYPEERKRFMIKDCVAKVVIAENNTGCFVMYEYSC